MHHILRYNGQTGAFLGVFVQRGSGGLRDPTGLVFAGGNLLISSYSYGFGQVLRYDGNTGAFLGVSASGVFARFLTFRTPEFEAATTQDTYVNGEALTVDLHLANAQLFVLPVEVKLWLDMLGLGPFGLVNVGADRTVILQSDFDQTGAFGLGNVSPSFPRGSYRLGCRLLNPVTGSIHSETIRPFTVQ